MKLVNVNRNYTRLSRALQICFLTGCVIASMSAWGQEAASSTVSAPDELTARYPSGSIQSSETASRALIDVDQQRAVLDQKYGEEQHVCYEKFFASNCLDAAKERRRVALAKIRTVEIEANAFIRSDRVVQRDKKLAEKRASDASNPPKPLADAPAKPAEQSDADKAKENQQRITAHEEKQKQKQQDAQSDAAKHADSAAAFDKKVKDAEARQRDVAAKKAEKARQAQAKAAAAAAASKTPTAAASNPASQPIPPAVKP
jgi:colicin import membrane protein